MGGLTTTRDLTQNLPAEARGARDILAHPTRDLVAVGDPRSRTAETVRGVHAQLQRRFIDQGMRSIAIVADAPRRGVSFLAANLAVLFAQSGRRTALVDGNLIAPRQHEIFGTDDRVLGLSDWLVDADNRVLATRYGINPLANLSLLPAGSSPDPRLLADASLPAIMNELTRLFEVVLYDTPCVRDSAGAMSFAARADRTLIVGRRHLSKAKDLRGMERLVGECHGVVGGVVLSDF